MNREDRAKQFMPFDALKGLHEELRARELKLLRRSKIEISEEKELEISDKIKKVFKGQKVCLTYFKNGYYLCKEGEVSAVDLNYKFLLIGEEKIFFEDVYDVEF